MNNCKENLTISGDICDLHTHSNFSDGSFSPEKIAEMAEALGLRAVALTDHNTVEGLPRFLEAGVGRRVKLIPGVEFSTGYKEREIHIVVLGIKEEYYPEVSALVKDMTESKRKSTYELVDALYSAGYKIDRERMESGAAGQINRAHIATELVRCGYVASRAEAFDTLLSKTGRFYREPIRIGMIEAIAFAKKIGAVAILAHPLLNVDESELRALLPDAIGAGLDAIEVMYSEYNEDEESLSMKIAEEYGLLPSGGSDFHGENKPDIALGVGRGNLRVPLKFAIDLGVI